MALYLELYHGRKNPDENLEDWGSEGPIFGPYENIQITYGSHIKMHSAKKQGFDDLVWAGPEGDLAFYDDTYYGDIYILPEETVLESPDLMARVREYSESKTRQKEA